MSQQIIPGLVVEIDGVLSTRSGVSAKTNQPYEMHSQPAWLHLPGRKHPLLFDLSVDEVSQAKPEASRWLVPYSVISIGRYGDVECRFRAADLLPEEVRTAKAG